MNIRLNEIIHTHTHTGEFQKVFNNWLSREGNGPFFSICQFPRLFSEEPVWLRWMSSWEETHVVDRPVCVFHPLWYDALSRGPGRWGRWLAPLLFVSLEAGSPVCGRRIMKANVLKLWANSDTQPWVGGTAQALQTPPEQGPRPGFVCTPFQEPHDLLDASLSEAITAGYL